MGQKLKYAHGTCTFHTNYYNKFQIYDQHKNDEKLNAVYPKNILMSNLKTKNSHFTVYLKNQ